MRRLINRTAALALSATVALGAAVVPCVASNTGGHGADGRLTRLSPASRQALATAPARREQSTAPTSSGSFFKSTRGKITLALMGAGTGLTLWSIQHDRKPVKSPIR